MSQVCCLYHTVFGGVEDFEDLIDMLTASSHVHCFLQYFYELVEIDLLVPSELIEIHRLHQDVRKELVLGTYTAGTTPIFQLVMQFIEGDLLILVHK